MKRVLPLPSKEQLESRLSYDPETGELRWKNSPRRHFNCDAGWCRFNRHMVGRVAGHKHKQQNGSPHAVVVRIGLDGTDNWLLAHRIIFVMMDIEIPDGMEIDHKDTNPWNNKWDNLRIATSQQNGGNKSPYDGRDLPKGVSLQAGRYKAQISDHGKKRHIGMYAAPEEAKAAYDREAEKVFGEFARA